MAALLALPALRTQPLGQSSAETVRLAFEVARARCRKPPRGRSPPPRRLRLRAPMRNALREIIRQGDALSQAPDPADVAALRDRRQQLDTLPARFKQLSAALVPLSEDASSIAVSRGRVLEWRNSLAGTYAATLRYLLLRTGMLAVALPVIFLFSELWRRATQRYIPDRRRRRRFLLLRRIVVGCTHRRRAPKAAGA